MQAENLVDLACPVRLLSGAEWSNLLTPTHHQVGCATEVEGLVVHFDRPAVGLGCVPFGKRGPCTAMDFADTGEAAIGALFGHLVAVCHLSVPPAPMAADGSHRVPRDMCRLP